MGGYIVADLKLYRYRDINERYLLNLSHSHRHTGIEGEINGQANGIKKDNDPVREDQETHI